MTTMSRRALLSGVATASLLPARTLKTVGVQLYTVRSIIEKNTLETLQQIEQAGYRECEVTWDNLEKIWPSLQQTKLKPVSIHLSTPMFTTEQDKLPAAMETAARKGFKYVVCPYVAPAERGGADVMEKMAVVLNKAGAQAKQHGMTLAYHNHAFEFAKEGGKTLLDHLLENSDPKLVHLEMDVMWVTVAGADPVALLKQYKGRVPLLHLKDVLKSEPSRLDEKIARTSFAEVGNGKVDFAAVLAAASANGAKHFFVEQDQTPGPPVDSLKTSMANLKIINF
jgi:sugar phosphate isomerase/epimerase